MSEHTAGPKIDIDGDLRLQTQQCPLTVVGVLQNPADLFQRGLFFVIFFIPVPIFHKILHIFVFIVCNTKPIKINQTTDI